MKAVNLRCEYMIEPIGIDIIHPRLSWNDVGLKKQSAFQIVIDINNKIYDTGKIISSSMHYDMVEPLSSRDIVTWKVKIFDDEDNESDYEESHFEMGLLNQDDFKAKWIAGNYKVNKKERYPIDCFKKEFNCKNIVKARLYASAQGLYEIKINGQRVGDFVFAPGFTDYRKRIQYQTYDVLDLLKEDNVLTAELGDGWYRGSIGARGNTNTYGIQSKLFIQLELIDSDGNLEYILSDKTFAWSNDGPIRFGDLKDGEIVDANKEATYSNNAIEIDNKVFLSASNNFFVKEKEIFKPIEKTISKTNKQIFKLPYNIAGYISFKINAKKNQKIDILMGEMLDDNGDVTLKNVRLPNGKKETPLQEIHYICKDGINEYKPKYYFGGFRYISVTSDIEFNLDDLNGIAVYSDMEETSTFNCSNELINIFYENTLRSLKGNSIDIPTDCPTRERMGWTGDSQVFFNSASYLMNYAPFSRKHIKDLYDRQWKDGKLSHIVPYSNEDWFMETMNGSVGWADAGVLIPYRYYLKYGDDRLIRDNLDGIIKYGNFMMNRIGKWGGLTAIKLNLSKESMKNIVNKGQSYGEWAEPNDVVPYNWRDFVAPHPEESSAYTAFVLDIIGKICQMFDRNEDGDKFITQAKKTKEAYKELVSSDQFSLDTDRQARLVRPLYMHLLDEEKEEYAKKRLIKALDNYGWRIGTGFLSTPFILYVLEEIDVESAYRLLENEEMPGWLYMAKSNTTTIWEGWEGPNSSAGIASLNHYSKGAMVEWLMSRMAGINVDGENHFLIKPLIGGKEVNAKASYNSVYGLIKSSWTRDNDKITLNIEIPANTNADVILQNGDVHHVECGNYTFEYNI